MCWLAALNPQLSRDPDPPVLSSGAERLPQPGGGGGQGRRGLGAGLGQVALLWGARRKRRTGRAGAGPGAQVGGETVTSDRLGRLGVLQVSRLGGDRTRPATGPSESR